MWKHLFKEWDTCVTPDLLRFYHLDTHAPDFWARSWRWLKPVLFSLYRLPDSFTATTYEKG